MDLKSYNVYDMYNDTSMGELSGFFVMYDLTLIVTIGSRYQLIIRCIFKVVLPWQGFKKISLNLRNKIYGELSRNHRQKIMKILNLFGEG